MADEITNPLLILTNHALGVYRIPKQTYFRGRKKQKKAFRKLKRRNIPLDWRRLMLYIATRATSIYLPAAGSVIGTVALGKRKASAVLRLWL